jgi:hypothetical protein
LPERKKTDTQLYSSQLSNAFRRMTLYTRPQHGRGGGGGVASSSILFG